MNLTHYGSHRHTECGLNDTDGTLKDSDTITLQAAEVTCPTCRGWLPIVAPQHTLRLLKELKEENASLREQISVCLREYVTLGGSLSIETRTKMEAASRPKALA